MKQATLHLITLLILALTTLSATAHDFEVDGIYYNINGTEATVTYQGSSYGQYINEYTGDVTIPETVTYGATTYSVTSIGYSAFNGCSGLTSIIIPNSVTSIDEYALRDCRGLTSITIPNSVTAIGNEAFEDCSSLACVTIPNSVTYIGDWAFLGCSGLTSIIIGDSVKTIGIQAFYGCTSLSSITIPSSVTSFHHNAFEGCCGITNINVESGNPSYDSRDNCNSIIETATNTLISGCMNTTIPNSVTAIGWDAFSGCYSLASITIPNSVTSIGINAFHGTAWFNDQPDGLVYAGLVAYKYKGTMPSGTSITIEDGTLGIADDAFSGCSGLISITIPNSVTSIGIQAFAGCSGLTSINLPNSVTSIGYFAFYGCSGLTSVTIPNSVTSIDELTFGGCSGLTNITIPNSVISIGSSTFGGCSGLTSITIPKSVTHIDFRAFYGCNSLTSVTSLAITPPTISLNAFPSEVTSQATLYVPKESLTAYQTADNWKEFSKIVELVFEKDGIWYSALTDSTAMVIQKPDGYNYYQGDIVIPETVTSGGTTYSVTAIGDYAFYCRSGLTSINIPNSVTYIGIAAFYGCGLTSITIPNSVTTIGDQAFFRCTDLTSITIPKSVNYLGVGAFALCSSLSSITFPNSVIYIGGGAFDQTAWFNNHPDGLVYAGLVAYKYKGTMPSGTSITIAESTLGIAGDAFNNCSGLTSITIPNSVTTIGDAAFLDCSGLTCVTCLAVTPPSINYSDAFPSEVTNQATLYVPIGSVAAYQAANNWKDFSKIVGILNINDFEVDGVWYQVLYENSAMVIQKQGEDSLYQGDVVIPDSVSYLGYTFSVTAIDASAFEDCYDLAGVVIGDAVETIGENAFQGCTGLTSVTIGSGVRAIGAKAFNYCNALTTVTCRGTVPPVMANANCFSNAAYSRAKLLVPRQQLEAYQATDYWYRFSHIDGWGSAGMGDVNADGIIGISDVTALTNALLTNSTAPTLLEYGDLNHNGRLDIGDVTNLIVTLLTH